MLDTKFIRKNFELVKRAARDKGKKVDLSRFESLDRKRREILKERDDKRKERRIISLKIGKLRGEGIDTLKEMEEAKNLGGEIKKLEEELKKIEEKLYEILIWIPNIPHSSVPEGNTIIREWGEKRSFDFEPLNYFDLCNSLGMLDFNRASKISGTNFSCYIGKGALLERALINFMLDTHSKNGYREVFPPFLTTRKSMFNTGQIPKLEDDMYRIEKDDLFLNPTAEVPITNLHQNEILSEEELPLKYVAYTACFRREAGSYGRETRGLFRIHQFNKIELVKFTKPEDSYKELESLLLDAEEILKLLKIPYRIILLGTSDMSFASAKTYDIEAWAPISKRYMEVSSCSNFEGFQARRGRIRYREKGKIAYVHTLNGSGLATPRTFIALCENYEEKDGSLRVPDVLVPYMGMEKIKG